ncbi:MAG: diguanylate cyclase, partial [Mariprofundus sp.]|nr:diguanylate cyclase [Mariprofundus sp.]
YGKRAGQGEIEAVEKRMLNSGKSSEEIEVNENGIKVYHYNGPLIASSHGALNCMKCHDAAEGDVLGGLSVQVDLSDAEDAIKSAIYQLIALLLFVGVLFAFVMRRMFLPMMDIVGQITSVFSKARHGDFSQRIAYQSNDEIGDISTSTNRLMQSLDDHIGAIARDIEGLTGETFNDSNLEPMQHMANVVHNLTSAVRFKEEIEADRDLEEVYEHFQRILLHDFCIEQFVLYEISSLRNRSVPVASAGLPDGLDGWCSSDVMEDAQACRAKRSVRMVDSRSDQGICPPFCADCKESCVGLRHICLPVLNSDGDGVVLQIIFDVTQQLDIEKKVSLLEYYLRVAAPEIEAKRLMRSLKESSLRDALTGMYNRRFLEEFTNSMEASVSRRNSSLGVLMCDIDLFKEVNDKRGHASGDQVLVETAAIIKDAVRASDLIVRYGGEEIVVLLMDADEDRSYEIAERIRNNIEAFEMKDTQGSFNISMSIGMSMYPANESDLSACIGLADNALYEAKESGRNKVVRYEQAAS